MLALLLLAQTTVADGPDLRVFWPERRSKSESTQLLTALVDKQAFREEKVLDDRVCDRCSADAAITDEGPFVVYRDHGYDNLRNIAIVRRTKSGWSQPAVVHDDEWRIAVCPLDGPAADADKKRVAIAWYAGLDIGRVRVAFSSDAGATFTTFDVHDDPNVVPLGRVDIALADDGAIVSYVVAIDRKSAAVVYRHVSPDGALGEPYALGVTGIQRDTATPKMEKSGDFVRFSWPDADSKIRQEKVVLAQIARGERSGDPSLWERMPPWMRSYTAVTLEGESVSLRDHAGKPVLLNLWATWCGPCVEEIPELIWIAKQHPQLTVIGISVDAPDRNPKVRKMIDSFSIPYPIWRDPTEAVFDVFGITRSIPLTILIDREGRVVYRSRGSLHRHDERLSSALRKLGLAR